MLDGVTAAQGGLDGNGIQIGRQFAEITSISAYSFIVSCLLLYILKFIPGMHLRVSEESEMIGLDLDQFFDEQIGDWGMFDELNRAKMANEMGMGSRDSHGSPVIEGVVESVVGGEQVKKE